MKVALVYDRVNKWGGAERVLLSLHELFPNAPLFTSVYNEKKAPWANVFTVKTSFLQKFPLAKSYHQLYVLFMPMAFERFSFQEYDLVISVTSEAAKGIITRPGTTHICYCLTPTRYLWSGYEDYFKSPIFRVLTAPIVSFLKKWDLEASQRPDMFIAIAKEVQERIKKYYGRESKVVYPPLPASTQSKRIAYSSEIASGTTKRLEYFLVVSRLVPYKRIDLAVKACNTLKIPLVIVGTGSEEEYLREIAGETIIFAGHLTERELLRYYKESRALIFPGREDFGLVVVEAQSYGKPVIAFRGGGALETILEGKTGLFFEKQTVTSLVDSLVKFEKKRFDSKLCRKQAAKFSFEKFAGQWRKIVKSV